MIEATQNNVGSGSSGPIYNNNNKKIKRST